MIEFRDVSKVYDGARVVDGVSLKVEPGTICTIVGASGSGKTTLMRMVNRMTEPTSGTVLIDGRDNRTIDGPDLRRRIGYVIQNHGLFPHRTVAENIATVPNLLKWERPRVEARVEELLHLFGLEPKDYAARYPHQLSGGQQQRVGVARALAARPAILLMDEPFGALDPIIRSRAQADLLAVQKATGTTVVLVTHDMEEAVHLGHRIAVMENGRLRQSASPAEILARPADAYVEEMLGANDRAFKLLSLSTLEDLVEPGAASGAPLRTDTNRRDALADLLWSNRGAAPVADATGRLLGIVRTSALLRCAARPAS